MGWTTTPLQNKALPFNGVHDHAADDPPSSGVAAVRLRGDGGGAAAEEKQARRCREASRPVHGEGSGVQCNE